MLQGPDAKLSFGHYCTFFCLSAFLGETSLVLSYLSEDEGLYETSLTSSLTSVLLCTLLQELQSSKGTIQMPLPPAFLGLRICCTMSNMRKL